MNASSVVPMAAVWRIADSVRTQRTENQREKKAAKVSSRLLLLLPVIAIVATHGVCPPKRAILLQVMTKRSLMRCDC